MINSLTNYKFAQYGYIYNQNNYEIADNMKQKKISINESNTSEFYFCSSYETIIDIIKGPAVIYLNNQITECFLLDNKIVIKPNVRYKVIPFFNDCEIYILYHLSTEKKYIVENQNQLETSRSIMIDKIYTLFYQEQHINFDFKGEKHHFWELTYIDYGVLETSVEGKKYQLKQGNIIFYPPNHFHTQKNGSNEPLSFITISFDLAYFNTELLTDTIFRSTPIIKNLFKQILIERERNDSLSNDLIICLLTEIVISLIRSTKSQDNLFKDTLNIQSNNEILDEAINYIQSNIYKKISVTSLAASIPISKSYLNRLFKSKFNLSPIQYINDYRLEKSKFYIKSSNLNLTQIADVLGYKNIYYFSKKFKEKYHITPSTYSKSIK